MSGKVPTLSAFFPAHTDGSVIQTGIVIALPCGDLQTTQSPPSRRNLRETGRFAPHRMDHR